MARKSRLGLTEDERKRFDDVGLDQINQMTDVKELHRLMQYMEEEGFPQTAHVVKNRMHALGTRREDDPEIRARVEADVGAFVSDLAAWTEDLKRASAADAAEPTPLRPRNAATAPIRNVPKATITPGAPEPPRKTTVEEREAARLDGSLAPSPADVARAEALAGLAGDRGHGTPSDDAPDEDLSVPNASPDVEKTLRAMAGATPRERRWVATREREKGNELFKAREYRSATEAYALAIALDPESAAAHANRAAALMKLRRWEAAAEDCTAALAIEPGHLKARMRRAACRVESGAEGAGAAAMEDLEEAEKIEPENAELRRLKAKARRLVADDKRARGTMRRVAITEVEDDEEDEAEADAEADAAGDRTAADLSSSPVDQMASADAAKRRGNEHFVRGEFADAVAAYTEALVHNPGMREAYCNRSGAKLRVGDLEGAESDAASAIALDATYARAFHRRAAARRALGRADAAVEDYDAAERLSSGDAAKAVAAERDEYRVEIRLASVAPARTGPMTFEEIEDEDEDVNVDASASVPEIEPSPSAAPSQPSDDSRRRIVIEEEDSDEEDSDQGSDEKNGSVQGSDEKNDSDEASDEKHNSDSSASQKDAKVSSIDPASAARAFKATGDDAFKRGEMETADAAYGACLAHPGASSDESLALAVRANRAAARLKLGDFVGAEEDACAALAIDPSHVKSTHRRAAARMKLGKFDDALADYAVVKRAFPKHRGVAAEVDEALAMAAESKKKSAGAGAGVGAKTPNDPANDPAPPASPAASKPSSAPSSASPPKSPAETARAKAAEAAAALKEKGNAAFAHGLYPDAVTHYDAAVKMCVAAGDPKTAAILLANRAAAKLKLGLHADAEKDASAAIAKDPGYVKGFHRRAQARSNMGRFEEALEDFEAVVRANPENETLRNEVNACMQKAAEAMLGSLSADALGRASAGAAAGSSGRRAVTIQPDSDDDSDDDDEGTGTVSTVERERDEDVAVVDRGAEKRAEKDEVELPSDPALEPAAPSAAQVEPKPEPSTRRRIPIVEDDSDSDADDDDDEDDGGGADVNASADTTTEAAPPVPSTPSPTPSVAAESAKTRGNDLFRAGDFSGAEAAYGEAIALAPDSAAYLANRAAARLKLGDHAGALADATEATRLDPTHARARHRRAVALSSLGRHAEAAAEYDAVERDIPDHAGVKAEAAAARAAAARAEEAKAEEATAATAATAAAAAAVAKQAESAEEGLPRSTARSPKSTTSPGSPRVTATASSAATSCTAAAASPSSAVSPSPTSKEAIAAKAAAAAALVSERKRASKPRTATEHERGCKSLRGDPVALSEFVSRLTDAELPRVVRESISAATLGAYAEVFEKAWMPAGRASETAATAKALSKLPRFAINAMLMSKPDKDAMRAVFDALGTDHAEVRAAWKL